MGVAEARCAATSPAGGPALHSTNRSCRAAEAFLWACALDVQVRKPGNVSLASPGHDMVAAQFLDSAEAAAQPLLQHDRPVGERVERAVIATREAAGCNTNLGILLLCAPVALAAERAARADADALVSALRGVLEALDVDDARAAYRAIALAGPGGLGSASEQDVADEPTIDLRAAMTLAADRDSIARQYATGFDDVLALGVRPFLCGLGQRTSPLDARVQALFLRFLAGLPDSHIVRKHGIERARAVSAEAAQWLARLGDDPAEGRSRAFMDWDESLKQRGLNPGTSADLTVCTLFVAALLEPAIIACEVRSS